MWKRFLLWLFILPFLAFSCGGGNITIILFPDEDEASITISRFGLSPTVLSAGTTFVAEWNAS